MVYTDIYESKLGNILLAADEMGIIGLWFEGQKYYASILPDEYISQETIVLTNVARIPSPL